MIGDIYKTSTASAYVPSDEVKEFTNICKKDYSYGHEILHRPWSELNDRSVIDDMNRGQRTFNGFVDESIEDPAEAWKWPGTRSKARNKAIAMHAQLTAGYIIPMFMAQNENSEEDRGFSDFARDGIEWMIENSEYKSSFLMTSMGMLVNPVTYMGADYAEVEQTIKKRKEDGTYEKVETIDEQLSGFKAPVYSADQVLISNAYDQNIQRHRFNIKRRYIEWSEARAMYEDHEYWPFVQPGVKTLYNDDDGLFYDVKDDDHPHLVEEVTVSYRRDDTEVCYLNGIYMGDMDTDQNRIRHRDNRDAPKYDVVPFGYQRVNEHFFYYKSLMNSMYWDNELLDAQYRLGMNRAFLDTNMPMAVSGQDKVDTDIVFPGAVVAFKDKETKVQPLLPAANLSNMFTAMRETEASMEETSVSATTAGQLPSASSQATTVAIAQRNAMTLLQGVGKTLAESMVQYGGLMIDLFINNYSIPEVEDMLGDATKLKYRTLVLKGKVVGGKEVTKVLKFSEDMLGAEMTEDERRVKELEMLKETGYPHEDKHIYMVNPELFARMKYLVNIEPERMFQKNEEFMQAMYSQLYAQLRNDPLISGEALVRKLLYAFFRGESEELMAKQEPQQIMGPEAQLGQPPQTQFGQMGQNKAAANGLSTGLVGVA